MRIGKQFRYLASDPGFTACVRSQPSQREKSLKAVV